MSYDISLYDRAFLKRALEDQLGDWTNADPLSADAVEAVVRLAEAEGFRPQAHDPDFVAFLREQGAEPSRELQLATKDLLATLGIHRGEVAFTIPYSPLAAASIVVCTRIARRVAVEHGLGFWDPQEGVAEF